MGLSRSGFYKWLKPRSDPSPAERLRVLVAAWAARIHAEHPSHGYRWINAYTKDKAKIDVSDEFVRRCCRKAGIRSRARHARWRPPMGEGVVYPRLLLKSLRIDGPMQVVVTDMTAFWAGGKYWELTWYMDLWNDEIVGWALSGKRGDPATYYEGMGQVEALKEKKYGGLELILHSDQGSVYSSRGFNEPLLSYSIAGSMSRAGTPADNAAMESVNGWAKEEMELDFRIKDSADVRKSVADYVKRFNEERPMWCLGYKTPKAYREGFEKGHPGYGSAEGAEVSPKAGKESKN